MDAVEFLKERGRMCGDGKKCSICALSIDRNGTNNVCNIYQANYPQETVAIVEKWSAEHPAKSYLDVFRECMKPVITYPNDEFIIRNFCIMDTIEGKDMNCYYSEISQGCEKCWHSECKLPIKGE